MADSQALDTPLCQPLPAGVRRAGYCIVLSHAVNMLGSKAWEFAVPLLLIEASGNRLVAPAVLGIATTAAEFLLGPPVGRWVDHVPSRMRTVSAGSGAQAMAVLGTLVVLLVARGVGCDGNLGVRAADPLWFGGGQPLLGGLLFAGLSCCGVAEVLGRLASTVSVERDWVPTAFEPFGEVALARVNSRMANVDLIGEIVGPLIAGAFFAAAPSTLVGFGAVALLNVLSFLPQLWLLLAAQHGLEALRAPHAAEEGGEPEGELSPTSASQSAWTSFLQHPSGVAMLTSSYALLFFTVLSSHDVVLTAFLAQIGIHPLVLSGFRAVGAAAGVLGATSFEHVAERTGKTGFVAGGYLLLQTVSVFVAAVALLTKVGGTERGPAWLGGTPGYMVPFLGAIVVSRIGLYGFDVGFSTLSQSVVDERRRGAVGAVTEGLCAFAQLCMYAATSAATTEAGSSGFSSLVLASACSVGVALAVYALWRTLYHEHEHFHFVGEGDSGHAHGHSHGPEHGHSHAHEAEHIHAHEHTAQQLRSLAEENMHGDHAGLWKHRHIHYHGPKLFFWS